MVFSPELLVAVIVALSCVTLTEAQCVKPSRYYTTWCCGFQAVYTIPISQPVASWSGQLVFPFSTSRLDIWTATVTSTDALKKTFDLQSLNWNSNLAAGSSLSIEYVIYFDSRPYDVANSKPRPEDEPCLTLSFGGLSGTTSSITTGTSSIPTATTLPQTTVLPTTTASTATPQSTVQPTGQVPTPNAQYDYDTVLRLSNLFYEAQRSGTLPADNLIPWRGNSYLYDKGDNNEDLTGGWFDAGDHVKFGFPMAGSTTMLLAGMIFFEEGYRYAGLYNLALREVKWPLDYFIKCHVSNNKFYGQVGNGGIDHAWWGRPEDGTMQRPAYSVGGGSGGADLLGETAAAMAAGSVVFKASDPSYSATLLTQATQLYEMAKSNPGVYSSVISDAAAYYRSDGYMDELAHAAAWIAYASGESALPMGSPTPYLTAAASYLSQVGGTPWAMDWSDKRALVRVLMYSMTRQDSYKMDTISFLTEWLPGGSVTRTPKGLAWRQQWGSLRYAANAALIALIAAKQGINQASYIAFAKSQIHYMLGDTGRSFVVGFGVNYPKQPHHKAASCAVRSVDPICDWNDFNSPNPNPQTLKGALVGGPDQSDNYSDSRSNYVTNEVACDYNAGFQGAVAGLKYFAAKGLL